MKFIIKPQNKGKTTELIKLAYENRAYMIVPSRERATEVFHYAKEIGYDILFPISVNEIVNNSYCGLNINAMVIDDIEMFIHAIIPAVPIIAISGTEL